MDRRLVAILAADVVGYSALVERDEAAAVEGLARLGRDVLRPMIARHRGRLFKAMGDGYLVEFGSALNALACAEDWQRQLAEAGPPFVFRIGLHLDDVLVDDEGDLLGDGVNIAARLQQIAPQGGVALSGAFHARVQARSDARFEPMGAQRLKNIVRPLEVWRLGDPATDRAAVPAASLVPEEGASVAVLAFANLARDSEDAYLAEGIADELVTTLGQVPWFFVTAETASFAPALRGLPPAEIGQRLGVRYLVEGAFNRSGARLRITVRLVEAATNRQLWSQRFDGATDEIFTLQDVIARQVIGQIEPRLRRIEIRRSQMKHGTISAYDFYLHAQPLIRAMTPADHDAARQCLEAAIRQNPEHAAAYGLIAWLMTLGLPQGASVDIEKGAALAERAIALDPSDGEALSTGGYALGFLRRAPALGIEALNEALALNPNAARTHDFLGWLLLYAGEPARALEAFEHSLVLSPVDEFAFRTLTGRAFALYFLDRADDAVVAARRAHAANPHFTVCHRVLAAALAETGDRPGARVVVADLLAHYPALTVARFAADTRFADTPGRRRLFKGLEQAGLPPG